jgi:hypothetical protein
MTDKSKMLKLGKQKAETPSARVSFCPTAETTMPTEAPVSQRVGEANTPSLRLACVQFQGDRRWQQPRIPRAARALRHAPTPAGVVLMFFRYHLLNSLFISAFCFLNFCFGLDVIAVLQKTQSSPEVLG